MTSLALLEKFWQIMIIYNAFKQKFNFFIYLVIISKINAGLPEASMKIGSKAPPVSLEKLHGGGFFHLKDTLKIKPIILLFFSSKNYQSLKMVSFIHQIKDGMINTDIDFYLVNIFEEREFLKSFVLDRYGISLKMFDSDILPTTIVINKGGEISYFIKGYDNSQLENLILHLRSI